MPRFTRCCSAGSHIRPGLVDERRLIDYPSCAFFLLSGMTFRFIVLLSTHPYFKIHALGASSRSAGKAYKVATKWKQPTPIPKAAGEMMVKECVASEFEGCEIIFSGLDSDVAGDIGTSSPSPFSHWLCPTTVFPENIHLISCPPSRSRRIFLAPIRTDG